MRKKLFFWVLMAVIPLILSGCLKNPTTGRYGPSWDIPLRVPLVSEKLILGEELSEIAVDEGTDLFEIEVSGSQTFNLASITPNITSVNFSEIVFEPLAVTVTQTVQQTFGIVPTGTVSFPFDISFNEFEALDLKSGVLEATVVTEGGNLTDAKIVLKDGDEILGESDMVDIAADSTGTLSIALDDVTVPNNLTINLQGATTGLTALELDFEFRNLKVIGVEGLTELAPTDLEFSSDLSGFEYDEVVFEEGTMGLSIAGISNDILTLDEVKIDDIALTPLGSLVYDLAGVALTNNSIVEVYGTLGGENVDLNLNDIGLEIDFEDIALSELSGILAPHQIDIGTQLIDLEMDLPDVFDDLELNLADAILTLEITNTSGVPIDLSDLAVTAIADDGNILLEFPPGLRVVPLGDSLIIDFTTENSNLLEVINARPTALEIGDTVIAGDGTAVTVNFLDGQIDFSFELTISSKFSIEPGGFQYRTESMEVNAPTQAIEAIEDYANDSVNLRMAVTNHLPLGVDVELRLSSLEECWDDPNAEVFHFTIASGLIDDQGQVISPEDSDLVLALTDKAREILADGGYAQAEISVSNDTAENLYITLRSSDFVSVKAWVELLIKINK